MPWIFWCQSTWQEAKCCKNSEQTANFVPSSCQGWVTPLRFGLQLSKGLKTVWMQGDERQRVMLRETCDVSQKHSVKSIGAPCQGIFPTEQRFLPLKQKQKLYYEINALNNQNFLQQRIHCQSMTFDFIWRLLLHNSFPWRYYAKATAMMNEKWWSEWTPPLHVMTLYKMPGLPCFPGPQV